MKKYLIPCLFAFLAFAVISCSDDNSEQPVDTSTHSIANIYTYNEAWSSQFYMGVKLAEVHSNLADLTLNCNAPEGYKVYLVNIDKKDSKGLDIYYISVDMAQVEQTSSTNEYTEISIPVTLTGTKTTTGDKVDAKFSSELHLKRYLCPDIAADQLDKNWYLIQDMATFYAPWVSYDADGKTVLNYSESKTYTEATSPLNIVDEAISGQPGNLKYFAKSGLPGWTPSTNGEKLPTALQSGLWKTGANPEPAVYMITDNALYCMSIDYAENGDMVSVHRYILSMNN